jgi:hypothetical protein
LIFNEFIPKFFTVIFVPILKGFFKSPLSIAQKQYEALRLYFVENLPATIVAEKFGYTYRGFTTIVLKIISQAKEVKPLQVCSLCWLKTLTVV